MPEIKKSRKSCHKCSKIYDKKLKQVKVCRNCHAITYCGKECQEEDWPRHLDNCVPVLITDVGEMGRGLIAAKDIKMGEQILIDTVAISLDRKSEGSIMTREVARSLKEQIKALPEEKTTQFMNLKYNDGIIYSERDLRTARRENCLRELKRFQSNRIETFNESQEGYYLFFTLSLINHSCAPNVEEYSLPKESEDQENVFEHELRAIKDISKGEEITIFYLHCSKSIMTKDMKQRQLKEKFGFHCKCSVCCGQVDDQDSIIEKIVKIFDYKIVDILLSTSSSDRRYEMSSDEWKRLANNANLTLGYRKKIINKFPTLPPRAGGGLGVRENSLLFFSFFFETLPNQA